MGRSDFSIVTKHIRPITQKEIYNCLLVIFSLGIIFVVSFFYPVNLLKDGQTICFYKNLLGIIGPGCGLTHSFISISHGDIVGAFKYNPLGPLLYLLFFLTWLKTIFELYKNRKVIIPWNEKAMKAMTIGVFIFWILRLVRFFNGNSLYDIFQKTVYYRLVNFVIN